MLVGHEALSVHRMGWAGVKNGKLLALASAAEFDVLLTADRGMEFQQNLATLPVSVLVVRAHSNRLENLRPLVPDILVALADQPARTLRKLGD